MVGTTSAPSTPPADPRVLMANGDAGPSHPRTPQPHSGAAAAPSSPAALLLLLLAPAFAAKAGAGAGVVSSAGAAAAVTSCGVGHHLAAFLRREGVSVALMSTVWRIAVAGGAPAPRPPPPLLLVPAGPRARGSCMSRRLPQCSDRWLTSSAKAGLSSWSA